MLDVAPGTEGEILIALGFRAGPEAGDGGQWEVGGEVFGEGRGDRCDPGGEAYLADGGGLRPVAGASGARGTSLTL